MNNLEGNKICFPLSFPQAYFIFRIFSCFPLFPRKRFSVSLYIYNIIIFIYKKETGKRGKQGTHKRERQRAIKPSKIILDKSFCVDVQ